MSKVRLVAYRKDIPASTEDSAYEFDLLKEPNISLNYQFSDIKEPEKRKGSYSQTFKLPFTEKNNKFFENWYNVNLNTLVFSSRKEYPCTIYVGTVPQFDGILQLRGVYQKAEYYDVCAFSNTASLFTVIGEETLREAFLNAEGTAWSAALNHTLEYTNSTNNTLYNSWKGDTTAFQNVAGESLRDSVAGVQKVMYNMSVTDPNTWRYAINEISTGYNYYLNRTQADIDANTEYNYKITRIEQFRPAMQIKEMLKMIIAKAGYSYTSTFIDSEYFGRIFMTTGGHLENVPTPVMGTVEVDQGRCVVGCDQDTAWGLLGTAASPVSGADYADICENPDPMWETIPINTVIDDDEEIYNTTYNYFTKKFSMMQQFVLYHVIISDNVTSCTGNTTSYGDPFFLYIDLIQVDDVGVEIGSWGVVEISALSGDSSALPAQVNNTVAIPDNLIPVGGRFKIKVGRGGWKPENTTPGDDDTYFILGANEWTGNDCKADCDRCVNPGSTAWQDYCLSTGIKFSWAPGTQNTFGNEVNVPACIDPALKQKDFLKDLIERFNLVVLSNPNDPSNIIIETYDTYLANGEHKYWTDKLDLSKEIIVKDTSSLQKESIHFTDKADVDVLNKEISERHQWQNVYGHEEVNEVNNKWAKGEMKNTPFFAPYINGYTPTGSTGNYVIGGMNTVLWNIPIHYETTYSGDYSELERTSGQTQPKLFYYCGLPVNILDQDSNLQTINLHSTNINGGYVTAREFTTYPVCTPYEITPSVSTHTYTLNNTQRSLYWNSAEPLFPDLHCFNYSGDANWWLQSLYAKYWKRYLEGLYDPESRMMEAYFNLSEVDIFNFSFNDEVFIKDSYWRIFKIQNYQVGVKASTKLTLIKIVDSLADGTAISPPTCDNVIGTGPTGLNIWGGSFYMWCPSTDADCTPATGGGGDWTGIFVTPDCCTGVGGEPYAGNEWSDLAVSLGFTNGELPCLAGQGSMPVRFQSLISKNPIISHPSIGGIGTKILNNLTYGKRVGSGISKSSRPLISGFKDDILIKYKGDHLSGESHRIVLLAYTEGNTTSYAYPQNNKGVGLYAPPNSNCMINVKAMSTVVGGKSSTHPVGSTETVSYTTAFRTINTVTTQVGTAGGVFERRMVEGVTAAATQIYMDVSSSEIRFAVSDSETDTKRAWVLTLNIDVQEVISLVRPIGLEYALYQDGDNIQLQDFRTLLWN